MTAQQFKPLPLGISEFTSLRESGAIYVDKTTAIHAICSSDAKILLTRPRRFGKSLLVSTFESLFKFGLRDFRGLAIEKLWRDKTYTVLRLDFSLVKDFDSIDGFYALFDQMLYRAQRNAGLMDPVADAGIDPLNRLASLLSQQAARSLVLLIDEYDAPLTAHFDNGPLFSAVRERLSFLYSAIKAYSGALRFFFMTGVTKLSNTSIFSAFNDLEDISLLSRYGTLLGYTEEEIKGNFAPYLDLACESLHQPIDVILEQLRLQYDGFSFDSRVKTNVYCPWSVLKFLKVPENGFENYWYQSGGKPSVLMRYLTGHSLEAPQNYAEQKVVYLSDFDAARAYDDMKTEVLLTQT